MLFIGFLVALSSLSFGANFRQFLLKVNLFALQTRQFLQGGSHGHHVITHRAEFLGDQLLLPAVVVKLEPVK